MSSSPAQDGNLFIITPIFDAILMVFPNFPHVKEGPLPASKSSIESLQTVKVTQEEECAICMMEYGKTGEAKEMPCKHKFHADCVNKWLGIHGSCPVCRFEMPVDEEEKGERDDEGGFVWEFMFLMSQGRVSGSGRDESGLENGLASEDMDSHEELNQDGIDDLE